MDELFAVWGFRLLVMLMDPVPLIIAALFVWSGSAKYEPWKHAFGCACAIGLARWIITALWVERSGGEVHAWGVLLAAAIGAAWVWLFVWISRRALRSRTTP